MIFAYYFKSTDYDFHAEKRIKGPIIVRNFLENCHFSLEWDRAFFIVQTAKNVSKLNNSDSLLNVVINNLLQYLLKEVLIVIQLECQHELVLELGPYVVVFGVEVGATHVGHQFSVEFVCVLRVLAKHVDRQVAFFVAPVFVHKEHILLLRIVNEVVVGKRVQHVQVGTCCQVRMVNCRLWHVYKAFVEVRSK